jgi:hypothetical protein
VQRWEGKRGVGGEGLITNEHEFSRRGFDRPGADASLASAARLLAQKVYKMEWIPCWWAKGGGFSGTGGDF